MIIRSLLAVLGALAITVTLLLAMDSVVSVFREDSGERYFRIGDVLARPDSGRPDRPAPVARQPETTLPEESDIDVSVTVEAPSGLELGAVVRELAEDDEIGSAEPENVPEPQEPPRASN